MIPSPPPPLTVLTECNETNSRLSKDDNDNISLTENISQEAIPTEFDYLDEEFQDNPIYPSSDLKNTYEKKDQSVIGNLLNNSAPMSAQSYPSNELEKLESALYRRISVGTFQKRLRIKNLTLTPKQSMQQILLLQSGDARPVVVRSTISQEIEISKTKSDAKDLNTLTSLSDTPLGWGIPIQIATVGFVFPEGKTLPCCSKSKTLSLEGVVDKSKSSTRPRKCKSAKTDKINQSLNGEQRLLGQGNQTICRYYKSATNSIETNHPSTADKVLGTDECSDIFPTTKTKKNFQDSSTIAESTQANNNISKITQVTENYQTLNRKEASNINYTTSLDILAGLLDEIQKITTCQTQMVSSDSEHNDDTNRDLENILNEAAALECTMQNEARQIISISSLDKLRQLESNPSIYSLYVSNDGDEIKISVTAEDTNDLVNKNKTTVDAVVETSNTIKNDEEMSLRPVYADKEVAVEFPVRELVNSFTDTPSRCNPIIVNNSTAISNSMLGVLSQPSSQSMLSFTENNTLFPDMPFKSTKKVIKLSNETTNLTENKNSQSLVLVQEEEKELHSAAHKIQIENKKSADSIIEDINIKKGTPLYTEMKLVANNYYASPDFDPSLKMKRDILVTVYSILVFTVFAALSFPELMYHI